MRSASQLQRLIESQERLLKSKQPGQVYRQRADYLSYLRGEYATQAQWEQIHKDWRPNNDAR